MGQLEFLICIGKHRLLGMAKGLYLPPAVLQGAATSPDPNQHYRRPSQPSLRVFKIAPKHHTSPIGIRTAPPQNAPVYQNDIKEHLGQLLTSWIESAKQRRH